MKDNLYSVPHDSSKAFRVVIPFTLDQPAQIYASVTDLSNTGLFLSILQDMGRKDQNLDETRGLVSIPNKYMSQIHPVSLPEGNYFLIIRSATIDDRRTVIRFLLDFLQINEGGLKLPMGLAAPDVCDLPAFPPSFHGPAFLHPVAGN